MALYFTLTHRGGEAHEVSRGFVIQITRPADYTAAPGEVFDVEVVDYDVDTRTLTARDWDEIAEEADGPAYDIALDEVVDIVIY